MVKPEMVNDDQTIIMAQDIVKKIENELDYPGQAAEMASAACTRKATIDLGSTSPWWASMALLPAKGRVLALPFVSSFESGEGWQLGWKGERTA